MSHLDEELMTALLDGELSPVEAREARDHIATCGECTARFEEARGFFEEANRLVRVLEIPAPPALVQSAPPVTAVQTPARRGLPVRQLAWAASIFLAIGLGYYGNEVRLRDRTVAVDSPAQVAAPAPTLADQQPTAETKGVGTPAPQAPATARAAPPAAAKDLAGYRQKPEAPPVSANEVDRLSLDQEKRRDEPAEDGRAAAAGQVAVPAPGAAQGQAFTSASPPAPRDAGAALTGNLQAESAAKLRADESSKSADAGVTGLGAKSAPAHRSYGGEPAKVTLEEAVTSLGGSIHLIDGLTPARVERLSGKEVPGAMPTLPLIRVVYLDAPMRELWLDQQRGAGANATADTVLLHTADGGLSLQWGTGPDGWLSLTGHLTADSLRTLARRVR